MGMNETYIPLHRKRDNILQTVSDEKKSEFRKSKEHRYKNITQ